ncbi:hypothetical protein LJC24_01285 [Desulfococcaceae bacterium OttesenSCG-928-F15]|nr:hypothetical protein [Desulfococcaceae bacterium OttesenSCG-928-F15]
MVLLGFLFSFLMGVLAIVAVRSFAEMAQLNSNILGWVMFVLIIVRSKTFYYLYVEGFFLNPNLAEPLTLVAGALVANLYYVRNR